MSASGVTTYADYRDVLESDPAEFPALFNTILINLTSFFRDPDCWTFLQQQIIPELIAARPDGEIRVWSAGCSTGEEPYSLAMSFAEVLGIEECANRVKIYGTDVDEEALRTAHRTEHLDASGIDGCSLAVRRVSRIVRVPTVWNAFRRDDQARGGTTGVRRCSPHRGCRWTAAVRAGVLPVPARDRLSRWPVRAGAGWSDVVEGPQSAGGRRSRGRYV
jgi:hypothetical protein